MDDYIKRSDAVHALCKAVHKDDGVIPCGNQTTSCLWSKTRVCDYARKIDALPSEDVVKVVRCKDCIHFEEHKNYGNLGESAYTCAGNMDGWIYPDSYCSNGRTKDG